MGWRIFDDASGRLDGNGPLWLTSDNIFSVLARGEALKALVFALLFGCALSRIAVAAADVLASSLEAVFHVCQVLTKWFNLFLPIVLFGMIASQIARSGVESLQAMSGFLATLMVALLLLLAGATWTIVHVSARPWRQVLAAQRECLSMALATQNTQACMPAMMDALPFDAAMALLVVVEPLSDAFRTVTTVAVGNAWTAAACGRPAPPRRPHPRPAAC